MSSSLARLNVYRALSSPSYIVQTSPDPILTAFELSQELTENGDIERHFVVSMSVRVYTVFFFFVFKFANEKPIPFSFFVFKSEVRKTKNEFVFTFRKLRPHSHIGYPVNTSLPRCGAWIF